jgi:hypothetical protein
MTAPGGRPDEPHTSAPGYPASAPPAQHPYSAPQPFPGQPGPGGGHPPVAPPAPPGPGVSPPFAAPPVDRSRRGLWIGLALGAIALVVCCVGGIVGIGVVGVAATDQAQQQAQRSVRAFLDGLRNRDYDKAHAQLCQRTAASRRPADLEREFGPLSLRDYRVGEARTATSTTNGDVVVVDATLVPATRGDRRYEFGLGQDGDKLRICRWRQVG